MDRARFTFLLLLSLLLVSCVTINVYFPAAAAEKAADQIIDKVWGSGEKAPETPQKPEKPADEPKVPAAKPSNTSENSTSWLLAVVDNLIMPVHAAEADLDISSPEISTLQKSLAKRFNQLKKYYDTGAIGLTHDGLIELHDASLAPLNERPQLNKLIQAENSDRSTLYSEIAQANNHPEWSKDIQRTFAKRWIDRAQKGWWYQTPRGEWKQK